MKYPVYIISKGRHERPLTSRALDRMGIKHKVVVEPQEYNNYKRAITRKNEIIQLPFSNLGEGSIPARNYVWDHSLGNNDKRHWILDDNIEQFNRMNHNLQIEVQCDSIFCAAEDFVDRYSNIALAGLEYDFFCKSRWKWNPFRMNTRVYSTILIDNSLPFRWRGKYNEDTDLSIRVLKHGYCTVLFLAFLQQKVQTMKMKGGNQDIYNETNDRLEFALSLQKQHPDCVKVTRKFNRWHHHVDYTFFRKNKLIPIQELPKNKINNYGMVLASDRKQTQKKQ